MTWDETTVEDFNALFEINVRGGWVVCTEAAKQMIAEGHGGAMVMIGSISAHVAGPSQIAYCGTKGAVGMMGKALGSVLGKHGIRVNVVEPGAIDTAMSAAMFAMPEVLKYYNERIALQRPGQACGNRRCRRLPAVRRCQLRHVGGPSRRCRFHCKCGILT